MDANQYTAGQARAIAPRDEAKSRNPAERESPERLVKQAMDGSRDALCDLCAQVTQTVFFHAVYLTGNHADAEDVAQETVLRMCEKIRNLRDPKSFKGWLGKITANEANRLFRKNAKPGSVLNIDDYLESITEEKKDFLPAEYAENEEYGEIISEVIAALPRRQRQAVMLRYYCDLSVTDVAGEMGIVHQKVSEHLALARERLKAEIEKRNVSPRQMRLYSLAPTSVILARVLKRRMELTRVDPAIVRRIMENAAPAIEEAVIPKIAASTAGAVKKAALIAASFVIVGTAFLTVKTPPEDSGGTARPEESAALTPQAETSFTGDVIFDGRGSRSTGSISTNPETALPEAESSNGGVTVSGWWITPDSDKDTVLYSGEGGDIGNALAKLRESHGDGIYRLFFKATDGAGFVCKLSRNFQIEESAPESG